jgi:hypothetical protein
MTAQLPGQGELFTSGELSVVVVVDMADDDRPPGQVTADLRAALERAGERIIYAEDLPEGVRILAPGEENGRA